jgi:hypothetical protein
MFTLIGLGTEVAYAYSVAAVVRPSLFPASFRGAAGEVDLYFEAAAVIVTLVLLGQWLELRARSQTGHALRSQGRPPPGARRDRRLASRSVGSLTHRPTRDAAGAQRPGGRVRVPVGGARARAERSLRRKWAAGQGKSQGSEGGPFRVRS